MGMFQHSQHCTENQTKFGGICQLPPCPWPHLWCDKTIQQLWQPSCLKVRFSFSLRGTSPLPFSDVFSCLQEASVIILLQRLLSLRDEGCRALDALFAVCNLLSQFSQPHHLEWKHRKAVMSLRSQITTGFAIQKQSWAKEELGWMALVTRASFTQALWWTPSSHVTFLIRDRHSVSAWIFSTWKTTGESQNKHSWPIFQQKERHFLVISAYMITKGYLDNHFPEIMRSVLEAAYRLTTFFLLLRWVS